MIMDHSTLSMDIRDVLDTNHPTLCDVRITPEAKIVPKLAFGRPIEDASPLLDREELKENMIPLQLKAENE
jgi:hypothetical protein